MTTKRRKVLSLFLALILSVSALPISHLTAFAEASGDFEYEILSEDDKTCEIIGYTGSDTVLNIPSLLDGYTVTGIGDYTFQECASLTDITIPNSVTEIGYAAFYGCASLTSVTISENVTSIGMGVFYGCASLTSVTIPESVTSIGAGSFQECTSLTDITIPNSVTSIDSGAFYGCTSLTSITIPDSVTSIGEGAFANCTSLENIKVDPKNSAYFSVDGVLFNKEQTELLCYPAGKSNTSYIIPESVTNIGFGGFYGCTSLTGITIPDSVTSINNQAFSGCTSLASITISDSVISIASDAFNGTAYYNTESNWENDVLYIGKCLIKARDTLNGDYTVKQGTKTIQGEAFYSCTSLTSVTIPDSVTSIGGRAFSNCASLKDITIPDSVTDIDEYAFDGCTSLTSITIPDGVTYISNGTFYGCTSLTNIIISDSVTSIGWDAFSGCGKIKILGFDNSAAKTYATENSIEFCLMGDIDGNGAYESNDYSMLAAQAKYQAVNATAPREVGDINLDGAVDAFDAIQLDLYLHNATDIHGNKIA